MFRREAWQQLAATRQTTPPFGWEDYDLWLAAAERGLRAELVGSIVGRYREQPRLDAQDQRRRHGVDLRQTPRTTPEVAMAELDPSAFAPATERELARPDPRAGGAGRRAHPGDRRPGCPACRAARRRLAADGRAPARAERQLAELRGTKVIRYTASGATGVRTAARPPWMTTSRPSDVLAMLRGTAAPVKAAAGTPERGSDQVVVPSGRGRATVIRAPRPLGFLQQRAQRADTHQWAG